MYKRLNLYLIKPSKYDDDGYVIRHWKGVLPSNTLACLYGLSEDVRERGVLGPQLKWHIEAIDETVQKVDIQKIIRTGRDRAVKTVVCLVGVQSNQFPRAQDLAFEFKKAGLDVMIGGFHVSGIYATLKDAPEHLKALQAAGVTMVAGEVEGQWETILRDALFNELKPVYNYLKNPPDLSCAPNPRIPKNLLHKYAVNHFSTLDCGRGCPFGCTFCTVINVQGRTMRYRSVDSILKLIRDNYRLHGIKFYFFTDDNFARNQNWEAIFDGIIRMREKEDIDVKFMIQADTRSHLIPNFIAKAERAGCCQAFIGLESFNGENLEKTGKKQNKTTDFQSMVDRYHDAGIATHLAYIIGFPADTEKSVKKDINRMMAELNAEQASFFMLTPLPGSADFKQSVANGVMVDADLNNFDSFHQTFRHANMQRGSWERAYDRAWKRFYSVKNLKNILMNTRPDKYWGVFLNFFWYKNAIQVEKGHPMLHGFFRLKDRKDRRKIFPLESRWVFLKRRVQDVWQAVSGWGRLAMEMEEVWLATRTRSPLEKRVVHELSHFERRFSEWRSLRLSELQNLYAKAADAFERSQGGKVVYRMRIPSRLKLWVRQWNIFSNSLTFTRFPMKRFWAKVRTYMKQGRLYRIKYHEMFIMFLREAILFVQFIMSIIYRTVVFPILSRF